MKIKIYQEDDYDKMSERGAALLSAQLLQKPDSVLGLATGSTPIGMYARLVQWYEKGLLDFSAVRTVNLDEYKGLAPDDAQSYRYFMNQHLFRHVNIDPQNTYIPDGLEPDSEKACRAYERALEELGDVDVQLLGMGHNGHIGFNEPDKVFPAGCHCVALAPRTIKANQKYFADAQSMPKQAYSMGVGTIMQAKKILLLVSGAEKAETLAQVLHGPITPKVPASILRFHPDVTLVADKAALSKARVSEMEEAR